MLFIHPMDDDQSEFSVSSCLSFMLSLLLLYDPFLQLLSSRIYENRFSDFAECIKLHFVRTDQFLYSVTQIVSSAGDGDQFPNHNRRQS